MKDVLSAALQAQSAGQRIVLTQLIETRGSTPQKAGAAMLVYESGQQVGTLGGGCVEAEVKQRALTKLATGESEVATFHLDHDYGWDDGLICGGRMTLLVSPVQDQQITEYLLTYQKLLDAGQGLTEAIVFAADADQVGQRILFDQNGTTVATTGTGAQVVEQGRAHLRPLNQRPRPYQVNGISYLPQLPRTDLLIVGAGHVGRQLAKYASDVDFCVTVVDDRENYCNATNIPEAEMYCVGEFDAVLPSIALNDQTCCVIVTRGHRHDQEALFHLIKRNPGFIGMIGSKRKIRLIFDDLQLNGIDAEQLATVHAPIGLPIGSQTVPEIAISIVAELIAHRNLSQQRNAVAQNMS